MRVPVYLPRFALPEKQKRQCKCACKKINMEYKQAALSWRAQCGDFVRKGDLLCEAEVEKTVIEICAPTGGRIAEICVQDGETCDVHHPIGFIKVN